MFNFANFSIHLMSLMSVKRLDARKRRESVSGALTETNKSDKSGSSVYECSSFRLAVKRPGSTGASDCPLSMLGLDVPLEGIAAEWCIDTSD